MKKNRWIWVNPSGLWIPQVGLGCHKVHGTWESRWVDGGCFQKGGGVGWNSKSHSGWDQLFPTKKQNWQFLSGSWRCVFFWIHISPLVGGFEPNHLKNMAVVKFWSLPQGWKVQKKLSCHHQADGIKGIYIIADLIEDLVFVAYWVVFCCGIWYDFSILKYV